MPDDLAELVTDVLDVERMAEMMERAGEDGSERPARLDAALERIDAENVDAVLDRGRELLFEGRQELLGDEADLPLADSFRAMVDRSSRESHAIQCSVTKEVDFSILKKKLAAREGRADGLSPDDAAHVAEVFDRQLRLNRVMSEIYLADASRRIALRKGGDPDIMARAMTRLDAVKDEALSLLDAVEKAAPEAVAVTPGLPDALEHLRAALTDADRDTLADRMYEDIAEPFSMMIGYDLFGFHQEELEETLGDARS